jgi:hypothetical protein
MELVHRHGRCRQRAGSVILQALCLNPSNQTGVVVLQSWAHSALIWVLWQLRQGPSHGPQLRKSSFRAPQAVSSAEHARIIFLAELKCNYLRSRPDATKFTEGCQIEFWFVSSCMLLCGTSIAHSLSGLIESSNANCFQCDLKFQRDL